MADENLTVRLWDAIHDARSTPSGHAPTSAIVAAVLPILAEEVRKAKVEAWERGHVCGYSDAQDTARNITRGPHNPYTKTGDSDEHR